VLTFLFIHRSFLHKLISLSWVPRAFENWWDQLEPLYTRETTSPWPLHFKHSYWWKRRSRSHFASRFAWGTNIVCECKMDVKSTMDSYVTSNGPGFMGTWTILKNHILETMALRMLTTIDLFCFIMCEGLHEYKFIEIAICWGLGHIWLHTTLEATWPHYMISEVSWAFFGHFFRDLTIS
jgi:hypothetical protein